MTLLEFHRCPLKETLLHGGINHEKKTIYDSPCINFGNILKL